MLEQCRDRVSADLRRFYGIRLHHIYTGQEDPVEVADAVAYMPRGGALGEWLGGHMAITAEVEAAWETTHTVAQVNSEKKISPRPFPEPISMQEARAKRNAERRARLMNLNREQGN